MNSPYIIAGILFLIIAAICFLNWHHKKQTKETNIYLSSLTGGDNQGFPKIINYSMAVCCNTVETMIDSIMKGNKIDSCRVLRLFGTEYDKFGQYQKIYAEKNSAYKETSDEIYLEYLWEATLKLAESGRNLVVHPDYDSTKSEVMSLGSWKSKLPKLVKSSENSVELENPEVSEIAETCRINKERISCDLREYTDHMCYADYEDGSQKYNFLSFLQYLYTFLMSLDNIMKPYRAA